MTVLLDVVLVLVLIFGLAVVVVGTKDSLRRGDDSIERAMEQMEAARRVTTPPAWQQPARQQSTITQLERSTRP